MTTHVTGCSRQSKQWGWVCLCRGLWHMACFIRIFSLARSFRLSVPTDVPLASLHWEHTNLFQTVRPFHELKFKKISTPAVILLSFDSDSRWQLVWPSGEMCCTFTQSISSFFLITVLVMLFWLFISHYIPRFAASHPWLVYVLSLYMGFVLKIKRHHEVDFCVKGFEMDC